jgi:hypothetical protein
MSKDSAQINVIQGYYNIYLYSGIKGDAFLSICHKVLSLYNNNNADGQTIAAMLFREISNIIEDDELSDANLSIDNSYELFCNLTITIDLEHGFIQLDGGDVDERPEIKRYNRYKMTIDYFIHEFFSTASL